MGVFGRCGARWRVAKMLFKSRDATWGVRLFWAVGGTSTRVSIAARITLCVIQTDVTMTPQSPPRAELAVGFVVV